MKITYDKKSDALYISLCKKRTARTIEVGAGFHFDVDEKGKLVGIEVLEASDIISLKDLGHSVRVVSA